MTHTDLDQDRDLSYSDKQLIAKAREDSRRLKEIQAHMSPEEKKRIESEVSAGLSNAQMRREEHQAARQEEEDAADKERLEFELKEKNNDLW